MNYLIVFTDTDIREIGNKARVMWNWVSIRIPKVACRAFNEQRRRIYKWTLCISRYWCMLVKGKEGGFESDLDLIGAP